MREEERTGIAREIHDQLGQALTALKIDLGWLAHPFPLSTFRIASEDQIATIRALGLKPRGFIAPAWLLGNEAEQAVRDAELEYTTRLRTVCDLRSESVFPARTLVYSVYNSWRRTLSRSWNAALFRLMN